MPKNHWTAAEFIAYAEKKALQLYAIKKEVPEGSNRWLLFGFEYSKRSSNYRKKFMLRNPIELDKLHAGPIRKSAQPTDNAAVPAAADPGAGTVATPPAIPRGV